MLSHNLANEQDPNSIPTFKEYSFYCKRTASSHWMPSNKVEKMLNGIFNILNELDLPQDQFLIIGFFF